MIGYANHSTFTLSWILLISKCTHLRQPWLADLISLDVVVIIYYEGNKPFDPSILVSQFNRILTTTPFLTLVDVFAVVRAEKRTEDKVIYRYSVSRLYIYYLEPLLPIK